MRHLPPLVHGSATWHLPLTEHAAGGVLRAVLNDGRNRRSLEWNELLRYEPTVVLWAICRSKRWDRHPPDGRGAVADWLADFGLSVLQWTDEDLALPAAPADGTIDRWARMAEVALAAATYAAGRAGESEGGTIWLCGLLHAAVDWLASCGPPPRTLDDGFLPSWLVPHAHPIEQDPRQSAEWSAALETARSVRRWWCDEREDLGRLLPAVMRRLRRLDRLEAEFQTALEREKLEALKELAYGASHEINNPLANISTRAQTLMREETDPDRRRKLGVINAQAFRAHEMISDMMLFARPPALEREPVELTALVDRVLREVAEEAAAQGTQLERVGGPPLTISADPGHLAVALKALCTNSLEVLRAGGHVEVAVGAVDLPGELGDGSTWARIVVSDDGPGISPEVRRHLFDPYFSGREAGRGLGLGLSKCWRIVTEHGGRIQVDSSAGRGAVFTLLLPAETCSNTPTAC